MKSIMPSNYFVNDIKISKKDFITFCEAHHCHRTAYRFLKDNFTQDTEFLNFSDIRNHFLILSAWPILKLSIEETANMRIVRELNEIIDGMEKFKNNNIFSQQIRFIPEKIVFLKSLLHKQDKKELVSVLWRLSLAHFKDAVPNIDIISLYIQNQIQNLLNDISRRKKITLKDTKLNFSVLAGNFFMTLLNMQLLTLKSADYLVQKDIIYKEIGDLPYIHLSNFINVAQFEVVFPGLPDSGIMDVHAFLALISYFADEKNRKILSLYTRQEDKLVEIKNPMDTLPDILKNEDNIYIDTTVLFGDLFGLTHSDIVVRERLMEDFFLRGLKSEIAAREAININTENLVLAAEDSKKNKLYQLGHRIQNASLGYFTWYESADDNNKGIYLLNAMPEHPNRVCTKWEIPLDIINDSKMMDSLETVLNILEHIQQWKRDFKNKTRLATMYVREKESGRSHEIPFYLGKHPTYKYNIFMNSFAMLMLTFGSSILAIQTPGEQQIENIFMTMIGLWPVRKLIHSVEQMKLSGLGIFIPTFYNEQTQRDKFFSLLAVSGKTLQQELDVFIDYKILQRPLYRNLMSKLIELTDMQQKGKYLDTEVLKRKDYGLYALAMFIKNISIINNMLESGKKTDISNKDILEMIQVTNSLLFKWLDLNFNNEFVSPRDEEIKFDFNMIKHANIPEHEKITPMRILNDMERKKIKEVECKRKEYMEESSKDDLTAMLCPANVPEDPAYEIFYDRLSGKMQYFDFQDLSAAYDEDVENYYTMLDFEYKTNTGDISSEKQTPPDSTPKTTQKTMRCSTQNLPAICNN